MLSRQTIVAFIVAGMTFGCAIGPDYRRPEVPVSANFHNASQISHQSPSETITLQTDWWKSFHDSVLVDLINQALTENLDLAQAVARVSQAKASLINAEAAQQPAGSIGASAARAQQSLDNQLGQILSSNPHYDRWGKAYQADLNVGWELDLFGSRQRESEAAMANYNASQAGVAATRLTVEAEVAQLYIAIRGLQARLEIAKHQVETQAGLASKTELLFNHGIAPEYQVKQAEAAFAQAKVAVSSINAELDAALNALDVMLGVPPGTNHEALSIAAPIPTTPKINSIGSPAELLWRRPDLIVAERKLVASNAEIGAAMAEYYPKFSLGALIGNSTVLPGNSMFKSGSSEMAGVFGLHWRLFDFNRIDAEIDYAKGQQALALSAYKLAVLRAAEDVESATSNFVGQEGQFTLLKSGESSLIDAKHSTEIALKHGVASEIDVLRSEEALLRISDARAKAQTESCQAAVMLFKALGGGWSAPTQFATSN